VLPQVFSMSALEVFRDDEMEVLLCGAGEHWTPQQLADSMKFDHGYTAQSTPVRCAAQAGAWHGTTCLTALHRWQRLQRRYPKIRHISVCFGLYECRRYLHKHARC
jgi:hypothetical protein